MGVVLLSIWSQPASRKQLHWHCIQPFLACHILPKGKCLTLYMFCSEDPEMKSMAQEETDNLARQMQSLEQQLEVSGQSQAILLHTFTSQGLHWCQHLQHELPAALLSFVATSLSLDTSPASIFDIAHLQSDITPDTQGILRPCVL